MRVFVCVGAYIWRPEFHLVSLSLVKGLSLSLELTDSATFAGQQWSAPFCFHPQHQAYRIAPLHTPAFFLGPGNLNLDSQAYTTIYPLSHGSNPSSLLFSILYCFTDDKESHLSKITSWFWCRPSLAPKSHISSQEPTHQHRLGTSEGAQRPLPVPSLETQALLLAKMLKD